jgi:hypothetical protein
LTVHELIQLLDRMPQELTVYFMDSDRDWLPLRDSDISKGFFAKVGTDSARGCSFFAVDEDDDKAPPNGIGIGT